MYWWCIDLFLVVALVLTTSWQYLIHMSGLVGKWWIMILLELWCCYDLFLGCYKSFELKSGQVQSICGSLKDAFHIPAFYSSKSRQFHTNKTCRPTKLEIICTEYRFHQTLMQKCWALLNSIQHTCRYIKIIKILPRHLLESGIVVACRIL